MSNQRFIEISSTYRNRVCYPKTSQFEIPFSPSPSTNQIRQVKGIYNDRKIATINSNVRDPVLTGIIDYMWYGKIFNTSLIVLTNSTTSTISVSGLTSVYKTVVDYCIGYTLTMSDPIISSSLIIGYNPSTFTFILQTPLTVIPTIGSSITITDQSTNAVITLPGIDSCGKNILDYTQSYNGYYLINETRSSGTSILSSKIVSYNYAIRATTLEIPFTNWDISDKYSIRKTLPNEFITVAPITPFILLSTFFPQVALSSNNCIFLGSSANPSDDYYTGRYIYIYPPEVANNQTTHLTNIQGSCFYINAYIGSGCNACFISNVDTPTVERNTEYFPSYTNTNILILPTTGTLINIVSFIRDNYVPLIYNGSVVSQNELVAYEISLLSLNLPNITLITGSSIAYYPFVYVEFTVKNQQAPNLIYSNNPKSNKAVFQVSIKDIKDKAITPFIKLSGRSMTQIIKFKPNDCLSFSVFLPNGKLFETVANDFYCPSETNPFTQIDALFGIRRIA